MTENAPEIPNLSGQGDLARTIAARGGLAAPEQPFVIEHREALIYMLCQAAELEHGIMCQYLFAAFSLKTSADEGLSADELVKVTRWRKLVSHVATQEMLHLSLVHNLLSAIGAAPHMARPNLPLPAAHYPAGVQLALLPFGEQALRHFMFLERPEGMDLDDAEGIANVGRAAAHMEKGEIVPRLQDFATVGHLYRSIENGIAHLAEKYGEQWLFVGPRRAQATQKHFRWPELVAVTDVASAKRAIDTILEQGEGARGDWRDAHFGQFVKILDEYEQARRDNPNFDPVRPVLAANVRAPERDFPVPLISDPDTARVTDLFNVGYEILLQIFERFFAHTEETDAQLQTLADATVSLMFGVIQPLGELITTLPAGPDHPGRTVGPSFELFYETDYLMPHREAAWALLTERLGEAVALTEAIRADLPATVGEPLAPISKSFSDIQATLAAHFPSWNAHARPEILGSDPAVQAAARQRADEFAERVAGIEARGDLADLFVAAYALTRQTTPAAVLPRLADSVLRPLSEALFRQGLDAEPTTEGRDDETVPPPEVRLEAGAATTESSGKGRAAEIARDGREPSGARAGIGDAAAADSGPVEQLRALAAAATRLGGHLALPELVEATAALQDLACAVRPRGERAALRAEFARLQADSGSSIRTAKNGPYLVTNAAVVDHLGLPLELCPTVALCRCGASALKPLCDGSHARIGFNDAKDPSRVADRRDTYVGEQITVFDNRGICQHSGLCTDRLSTVFRTNAEPFVAPNGGRMDEIVRAVRACPSGALGMAFDGIEARDLTDWSGTRAPVIEVTKDGPYRIRGSIPLAAADGTDIDRAEGASREHYALCRCGQSQNKPFCSGMHWYVGFQDPVPAPGQEPTLFEWSGGYPALRRVTALLYDKLIPEDELLAPVFAAADADRADREAEWMAVAFGAPRNPDEPRIRPILSDAQRERWTQLLLRAARESGLPPETEFRSAFAAFAEWAATAEGPAPDWDWGPMGTPSPQPTESIAEPTPVVLPAPDETVSFATHIKPLFREKDQRSMGFVFDLWSLDDVTKHAPEILDRLAAGTMPCDGPWPAEQIEVFRRWTESGMTP
ncbi:ferritin-like domain-containing protein [Nocardia sp. CDC153]|uniref:ferritin-like domain-containing protein n=1 Tax=Nocardia sp. CDC153 TaxID=3112167 RepID=UPI002DB8E636|nr:ferritin-like domain-containing protein [Nocardia sp. CDC153]MEC3952788.1 ferritin-like domain-containing protein [Nocardia sp. CDC153]